MNEIIFLVQEAAEGGYEARALSDSIYTEADTLEELKEMLRDAVACHFEGTQRPSIIRLHYVRDETIAA
jgi:predicted RNase H-like HicB family nuclease